MLPVVFVQMLGKSADRKIIALVLHTCAIVINKGAIEHRNQSVVTKATLDHTFTYYGASYMTVLPALKNIKLIKAGAFEFSALELVIREQLVCTSLPSSFLEKR